MENNDKFWELATSKLHNEITEIESSQLDVFLEEEKYKNLYLQIKKLKKDLTQTGTLTGISQNKSWDTISANLKTQTRKIVFTIIRYAAIIVFAFSLGIVFTQTFNNNTSGFAEVKVPPGQMSEIKLHDGTKVWLNSGTTMRYASNFGKKQRNVSLDGEAFFEVSKNKIPFKVKLQNTEVEVLGTTFNVMSYQGEEFSQITLVEGKVKINNPEGLTLAELNPSDQFNLNNLSNKATIAAVETNFYTSWTEGKITFEDETLSEIAIKMERWYNVDIRFSDESVGNLHFSGTILKHKPFNQIITVFELLLPVKIEYLIYPNEKDVIIISKK